MRKRIESANLILLKKLFEKWEVLDVHFAALHLRIDKHNVRQYLKLLHSLKEIHIVEYSKQQRGPALPRYKIGKGKDVEYPSPLHWKIKKTRYKEKKECLSTLWWISKPQVLVQDVVF